MTGATALAQRTAERLKRLDAERVVQRIWERDPTVWSKDRHTPELADRLGWLDLPGSMRARVPQVVDFAERMRGRFDRVVLCGMGGSSLAPEVLWRVGGGRTGYPRLHLLDSTHPAAVAAAAPAAALPRTLFLIASKSGTTIETASFDRYFWERTGGNGAQFVAVTDPGTTLARSAAARGFAGVFESPPDVGGRFSALAPFGLVPAALIGLDLDRLLGAAAAEAERLHRPAAENPGAVLGALIGEGWAGGRDKLTLVWDEALDSIGLWVEQLVAESTGKQGRGVVPVSGEAPGGLTGDEPGRIWFARTQRAPTGEVAALLARLQEAGAPLDAGVLADPCDLGALFLRFEFATAVAGAILGVNPFDQPNVAESKAHTARVLATGVPPSPPDDAAAVRRWLDGVRPGDYAAVMAYLAPSPATNARLTAVQHALGARLGVAVTVGYGPRFLHSTGQLHKGGPPVGHFVQIVDRPADEVPVPGESYGFGRLIAAQAEGDLQALRARGRPAVRLEDWTALEALLA
jgi:glucose-6-phosphate isomerase